MKGTIKFFNVAGWGFITGSDGIDVFVHHSDIQENWNPAEGQEVSYDVEMTEKGPKAKNCKPVEP